MKISVNQIAATLKNPNPAYMAWLVYGPDEGKVREYGSKLAQSVLQGDTDPLRVSDFLGSQLKDEPAKFFDEVGTISMFGGQRVLRIRSAKDEVASIVEDYVNAPNSDTLVIIEAGDLKPRSKLRLLFEKATLAGAIPCYLDEARDIAQMAQEVIASYGMQIERSAQAEMLSRLGSDRALSRSEVEKICLYKGEGQIELEDIEALLGDSSQSSINAVIMAAASGNIKELEQEIQQIWGEAVSPISLLRAANNHFLRLQQAAIFMQQGLNANDAVSKLAPPIFFKVKPLFIAQLRLWSIARISQALELLNDVESQCKAHGNLAKTLTHRLFIRFCMAAGRAKKGS
ncbi:MAG: DNA polymerase III subunit delta [Alphaproteobacteria bacterium]